MTVKPHYLWLERSTWPLSTAAGSLAVATGLGAVHMESDFFFKPRIFETALKKKHVYAMETTENDVVPKPGQVWRRKFTP